MIKSNPNPSVATGTRTGVDGDAVIDSLVSFTRDMHYKSLTLRKGGVIRMNGHKMFVEAQSLDLTDAGHNAIIGC